MKSGAPDHPKMLEFADAIQSHCKAGGMPLPHPVCVGYATGIVERLFHFAARYAPAGDIGKTSDNRIAAAVCWPFDATWLVTAGLTKWIDQIPGPGRLYVHDWHDHCEDSVHKRLARDIQPFANGRVPKFSRLEKKERDKLAPEWLLKWGVNIEQPGFYVPDKYLDALRTPNGRPAGGLPCLALPSQATPSPPSPLPPFDANTAGGQDADPLGGWGGGSDFDSLSGAGPRDQRSAGDDLEEANAELLTLERSRRKAGWGAVQDRLAGLGINQWRKAVEEAKECGCTPGVAMALVEYGRSKGYGNGAIVCRLAKARPTMPVELGWPPLESDRLKAEKAAISKAEKSRLEAAADAVIKSMRRERKTDAEIIEALAAKGLEWPK